MRGAEIMAHLSDAAFPEILVAAGPRVTAVFYQIQYDRLLTTQIAMDDRRRPIGARVRNIFNLGRDLALISFRPIFNSFGNACLRAGVPVETRHLPTQVAPAGIGVSVDLQYAC